MGAAQLLIMPQNPSFGRFPMTYRFALASIMYSYSFLENNRVFDEIREQVCATYVLEVQRKIFNFFGSKLGKMDM